MFHFNFFSTKISPDWSTVRLYACINSVNIIAEEDISYFNEAWLDFTANLSADLCYKSFVVTVIWLDLRLSSFKCIDNQRNPFSTYFKTRQNAARVIFVLRWTRTWFVEKKSNLKGLKWWPEEIKRKIKHRYKSEEDITIKMSMQHFRFQRQQLFNSLFRPFN